MKKFITTSAFVDFIGWIIFAFAALVIWVDINEGVKNAFYWVAMVYFCVWSLAGITYVLKVMKELGCFNVNEE